MNRVQPAASREEEDDEEECLSALPAKLRGRLLPFQRDGVRFALSKAGRCMIADEMGLGKTLQALAVAYLYRQEWPLLIVVPSSLRYTWIEELERWIPNLDPEDINLVESKTDTAGISRCKVTVLGYGLLTTDARSLLHALTQQNFQVVLVDEAHYLKSRNAARTNLLVPLIQRARRALLLTGTPALGRPEELFMQVDALYPQRFGTWSEYAKKYCNAHYRFFGSRRQWDCRGASNLEDLHKRLGEIMIRRQKSQVLTQLPPKIRQRIPFDLPKDAAKEASACLEEWERLQRTDCTDSDTCVMSLVTRMYKHTAIAKAGAVKDYIKMMLENEKLKFLVFAHHLVMLQACTESVIEAKARYIRIDGSVPSSERVQLVHQFQNDPDTRVAILSIQAAGQGLTFTAATHVVFAELYWNPGHVKQAEDRAHRLGQTGSVHVHYLIAKGTFDTVMWAMLNRKETVTGSTLNGRKEYLKAETADEQKFEFLNFASVWKPSETSEVHGENDGTDTIFFSHFEKDKQHDIRTFFSPTASKEKKKRALADREGAEPRTPNREEEEEEEEAFSPQVKRLRCVGGRRAPPTGRADKEWSCSTCTYKNSHYLPYCEMCQSPHTQRAAAPHRAEGAFIAEDVGPKPGSPAQGEPAGSTQDLSLPSLPVNQSLRYRASRNTDRIFLYTKDGCPLHCSFIPMDIKLDNWEDLPEDFSRGNNRKQLQRLVCEWDSLTATKQRMIRRSGSIFLSPTLLLDEIISNERRRNSTKRYLTKEDVAQSSLCKAQAANGSIRIVPTNNVCSKKKSSQPCTPIDSETDCGYVQALDEAGVPLCLCCTQPCASVGSGFERFCGRSCQEEFQLRSSQSYMRARMLETERGVCQSCGLQAHTLYARIRDAPAQLRKDILEKSKLAQLSLKQLNEMIRSPQEGQFWQVDHIRPVYSGGGQCLMDNLQTLCTVCHRERTAQQAKERSQVRRRSVTSGLTPDISKFFLKK